MLEIKNLSFSYNNKDIVLDDISFNVEGGNMVAILGRNGVGKTTLMKCVLSLLKPTKGQIILGEKNIKEMKVNERSCLIGYVPQKIEFSNSTVFDAILIGRRPYFKFDARDKDYEITERVIKDLKLEDLSFKNVNELSGGERQKVAIARALVQEPKLLYLDEPTSSLDIKNQLAVLKLVKEIAKRDSLIVLINIHDINLALRYFDSLILLKDSKVIKDTKDEKLTSKDISDAFGIDVELVNIGSKVQMMIKEEKE